MTGPVLADRWPARITTPWGITESARVVLTDSPPELFAWAPEGNPPRPIVHCPWTPAESTVPPDGKGEWRIVTDQGDWVVTGGVGCGGCGSVMQVWQPFSPMRFSSSWPTLKESP